MEDTEIRLLEAKRNERTGFLDIEGNRIYAGDTVRVVDTFGSFPPFTGVVFQDKGIFYLDEYYEAGEDADPEDFLHEDTYYFSVFPVAVLKRYGIGFYSNKTVKRFFYNLKDRHKLYMEAFEMHIKMKNQKDIFFQILDRGLQWD